MKKEDYALLIEVVRQESTPTLGFNDARLVVAQVRSIAHRLQRIAERQCNGHQTYDGKWDEVAAKKDEEREAKLEEKLKTFEANHGLSFHTQGDPRGYVVKLHTPKSERYNTMGGKSEGWGVE
jgi:hypothetical protein